MGFDWENEDPFPSYNQQLMRHYGLDDYLDDEEDEDDEEHPFGCVDCGASGVVGCPVSDPQTREVVCPACLPKRDPMPLAIHTATYEHPMGTWRSTVHWGLKTLAWEEADTRAKAEAAANYLGLRMLEAQLVSIQHLPGLFSDARYAHLETTGPGIAKAHPPTLSDTESETA